MEKRAILGLALIPLGIVLGSGYWLWAQWRPYESNPIADSSWKVGGQPWTITFQVVDSHGTPLPSICVSADDPSGGTCGNTGQNGEWVFLPDGGLLSFSLNGVRVMKERDLFFAPAPSAEGWKLRVIVKDLGAIQ
jgi:hypothetical protein